MTKKSNKNETPAERAKRLAYNRRYQRAHAGERKAYAKAYGARCKLGLALPRSTAPIAPASPAASRPTYLPGRYTMGSIFTPRGANPAARAAWLAQHEAKLAAEVGALALPLKPSARSTT